RINIALYHASLNRLRVILDLEQFVHSPCFKCTVNTIPQSTRSTHLSHTLYGLRQFYIATVNSYCAHSLLLQRILTSFTLAPSRKFHPPLHVICNVRWINVLTSRHIHAVHN